MKKSNKNEKTSSTPKELSKKAGRREFLERTGLTAGGVLMTTLAAAGSSKGQNITTAQQRQLAADDFRSLFYQAMTDRTFQNEILTGGFKALEARGYHFQVPLEVQATLEQSLFVAAPAKPRCGVCGVCGLCGLCAEVNAGSASAALWALFHLA
jgi:hypothetical protein